MVECLHNKVDVGGSRLVLPLFHFRCGSESGLLSLKELGIYRVFAGADG